MSLVRTIDAMVAAGCSPEQLAAVVRAHAAADQERLIAKRAADAERQRKSRLSRSVTVTERDGCDEPPLKETSPRPPKENYPLSSEPSVPRCESARRHEWPADFGKRVWAEYPRKTEKQAGMNALAEIHRRDRLDWQTLIDGVRQLSAAIDDPKFAPALHRWLKKARWDDQHPVAKPTTGPPPSKTTFGQFARAAASQLAGFSNEPDRQADDHDGPAFDFVAGGSSADIVNLQPRRAGGAWGDR